MRYELSALALSDLFEIIEYSIARFGGAVAREYRDGLFDSFEGLTAFPGIGRLLSDGVRQYVFRSHVILYEIKGDVIQILSIRSARQRWPEEWR